MTRGKLQPRCVAGGTECEGGRTSCSDIEVPITEGIEGVEGDGARAESAEISQKVKGGSSRAWTTVAQAAVIHIVTRPDKI